MAFGGSSCLKPLQCRIGLGIGAALSPGQRIVPAHQQDPVDIGGLSLSGLLALFITRTE